MSFSSRNAGGGLPGQKDISWEDPWHKSYSCYNAPGAFSCQFGGQSWIARGFSQALLRLMGRVAKMEMPCSFLHGTGLQYKKGMPCSLFCGPLLCIWDTLLLFLPSFLLSSLPPSLPPPSLSSPPSLHSVLVILFIHLFCLSTMFDLVSILSFPLSFLPSPFPLPSLSPCFSGFALLVPAL